jgi:hypothetical protein
MKNAEQMPIYNGPRFGCEPAEMDIHTGQRRYTPAIYDENGAVLKASPVRLPYGEAFDQAYRWSKTLGPRA